jgi:hypothetical protein
MDIEEMIAKLSREQIVRLLEQVAGIQCYDGEGIVTLREALRVNVEDGTIDESYVCDELMGG